MKQLNHSTWEFPILVRVSPQGRVILYFDLARQSHYQHMPCNTFDIIQTHVSYICTYIFLIIALSTHCPRAGVHSKRRLMLSSCYYSTKCFREAELTGKQYERQKLPLISVPSTEQQLEQTLAVTIIKYHQVGKI